MDKPVHEGQFKSAGQTINFTDADTLRLASDLYQLVDQEYHGSKSIDATRLEEIIRNIHAGLALTDVEWNMLKDIRNRHQQQLDSWRESGRDGEDPEVPSGSGRIGEAATRFNLVELNEMRRLSESYKTESATAQDRNTTSPHLLDGALHDFAHAKQHMDRMDSKDVRGNETSEDFNLEHARKHLESGIDHLSRLGKHLEQYSSNPRTFAAEREMLKQLREALVGTRKGAIIERKDGGDEPRHPTVCVDFDGVVHQGPHGLPGKVEGTMVEGAQKGLKELSQRFRVVLLTARTDLEAVKQWLSDQGVEKYIDEVTNVKPPAMAYIDDRATHFTDWPAALAAADPEIAVTEVPKVIRESMTHLTPPNLRDAEPGSNERCATCEMYNPMLSVCRGYENEPVRAGQVCNSYELDPNWEDQLAYLHTMETDPVTAHRVGIVL